MNALDAPGREQALRDTIRRKAGLRQFYEDVYGQYAECLSRCPTGGVVVELGSGAGFARECIPGLISSDVIVYRQVSCVFDARRMPFASDSLSAILMFNVFHHIADVAAFLSEASDLLKPGGRLLIVDQHPGWISAPILRYAHHEHYDPWARQWQFAADGPLSGANGALAWIVFQRNRELFQNQFPQLRLRHYKPHSPLSYWLAGGLKSWSLLPGPFYPFARRLDKWLARLSPQLCSFVSIELERV